MLKVSERVILDGVNTFFLSMLGFGVFTFFYVMPFVRAIFFCSFCLLIGCIPFSFIVHIGLLYLCRFLLVRFIVGVQLGLIGIRTIMYIMYRVVCLRLRYYIPYLIYSSPPHVQEVILRKPRSLTDRYLFPTGIKVYISMVLV